MFQERERLHFIFQIVNVAIIKHVNLTTQDAIKLLYKLELNLIIAHDIVKIERTMTINHINFYIGHERDKVVQIDNAATVEKYDAFDLDFHTLSQFMIKLPASRAGEFLYFHELNHQIP